MNKRDSTPKQKSSALRLQAEQLIVTKPEDYLGTLPEPLRLLHELRVHQIELEMQNQALQEARDAAETALERYQQLFDYAPIAKLSLNKAGVIQQSNFAASKLLDLDRQKLAGENFVGFVSNDFRLVFNRFLEQVFTLDGAHSCELALLLAGKPFWVSILEANIDIDQQTCLVSVIDISARKSAELALQLAATIYLALEEAIMVADENNLILLVNPAFSRLTGYSADEAIGQTTALLKSGQHEPVFYQEMWKMLNASGNWQGEMWNRRKDGKLYLAQVSINTVHDDGGQVLRRVATSSDITEQKRMEEAIKQDNELIRTQANIDPLTGLPNRRLFMDRLQRAINLSHRSGQKFALMFLDLDHFKDINDTLGHDVGDCLLKETSKRLAACIRETDTLARPGGDEFTLIMGEMSDSYSIDRVAQGFLKAMTAPFQLSNERCYVSVSIGIALYPDDGTKLEDLLKNADQAMYAAKEQGRNRFCYFTPAMQAGAELRLRLTNDLRQALAENQIWVAYQPIIELTSGAIKKAEALIRWQHPVRGAVSPSEFIGIAEDTGMIIELGKWVFHQVASQVATWRNTLCPEFQISLNKSPVQFHNASDKLSEWFEHLRKLGLPGLSMSVEITESLLLDDSSIVTEKLLAFKHAGVQVSLDDFGTGYSSLSYLKKYHIDYLKIDKAFMKNLSANSTEVELCKVIIKMAHVLGMQVIAEGVETAEQRDLLIGAECEYAQGYFFAEPLSALAFEDLYHSKRLNQLN